MRALPADTPEIQDKLMSMGGFAEAVNNSGIALEYAIGLYRTVLARRPKLMLEVGMARGASTLTILAALRELGGDRMLISIDPGQSQIFGNAGVNSVKLNGLAGLHRLIEAPDYVVLPDLLRQQVHPDVAYIDGWHTVDYTLLDFFYVDKLLPVGGVVGFNDCGFRAVFRVLRFIETHRHYKELDVGLEPNYKGSNIVASIGRRVLKRVNNDRWFEKSENWEPDGMFYAPF